MSNELKPCPFCGGKAGVNFTRETYQSVGCKELSMLCPNPNLVVYKNDDGEFDYTYWNRRVENQA